MAGNITKRVYCKRTIYADTSDKATLQAKLEDALMSLKKIGKRKESLGEDGRYIRSIIYNRPYKNMIFGILAGYERGTHQLTVAEDDDAEILTVSQVAPPKNEDDKRQEFLEGLCYFGIAGNHVIVAPSRALGVYPLENHLNWILHKAGKLGVRNSIALADHIAQATRDRIRTAHAKEIEIGTPFIDTEEIKQEEDKSYTFGGLGLDMLRQVLPGLDKMKLVDAVDGNIEVKLKIRFVRSTTQKAHRLLDNIALAMRNVDEDDVVINLVGGGKVKGKELKVSAPFSVPARDGIPNPDILFEKMQKWLVQQLDNKTIEP